eukprot:2833957-Rhodomonas_salina.1
MVLRPGFATRNSDSTTIPVGIPRSKISQLRTRGPGVRIGQAVTVLSPGARTMTVTRLQPATRVSVRGRIRTPGERTQDTRGTRVPLGIADPGAPV